jgi:hypothetical protein
LYARFQSCKTLIEKREPLRGLMRETIPASKIDTGIASTAPDSRLRLQFDEESIPAFLAELPKTVTMPHVTVLNNRYGFRVLDFIVVVTRRIGRNGSYCSV